MEAKEDNYSNVNFFFATSKKAPQDNGWAETGTKGVEKTRQELHKEPVCMADLWHALRWASRDLRESREMHHSDGNLTGGNKFRTAGYVTCTFPVLR